MDFRFILYAFTLLLAFGNSSFSKSSSNPAPTLLRSGGGYFIENADLLYLEAGKLLIFVEELSSRSDENDSDSQPIGPHNAALRSVPVLPAIHCQTLPPVAAALHAHQSNIPIYLRNRVFRI